MIGSQGTAVVMAACSDLSASTLQEEAAEIYLHPRGSEMRGRADRLKKKKTTKNQTSECSTVSRADKHIDTCPSIPIPT